MAESLEFSRSRNAISQMTLNSRPSGSFPNFSKKLDDGWPESEKGKDVDVKYVEERRRCEKISEERMNI